MLGESEDEGRTWKNHRVLFKELKYGDCPAELLSLPDGTVALIYQHRYPPDEAGPRAIVSRDEGRTWEPQTYLFTGAKGYPDSEILKDGTVVTVGSAVSARWQPDLLMRSHP